MDDQQTPAPEAGDDVVRPDQGEQSEATENTQGQDQDPPADDDAETPAPSEDEVSKSKARRERRKARMEALEAEAREARENERKLAERLRQIEEAAQGSPLPKEADFQTYDEYLAALAAHKSGAEWDRRQKNEIEGQTKAERERLQRLQDERKQAMAESWTGQVEEARTRYADFDTVFDDRVPVTDFMAEIIASSDVGADVAYYLGTNRQEAAQIARMQPYEAARHLGRIEARAMSPTPQRHSEAPAPIKPTRPKASAVKDPSKMTMDEYRKAREAGQI